VLGGELLQLADEFGRAGQPDGYGWPPVSSARCRLLSPRGGGARGGR